MKEHPSKEIMLISFPMSSSSSSRHHLTTSTFIGSDPITSSASECLRYYWVPSQNHFFKMQLWSLGVIPLLLIYATKESECLQVATINSFARDRQREFARKIIA